MVAREQSQVRSRVAVLGEMMERLAQRLSEQRAMVERLSRQAGARR
jgi:hypothetical protein